MGKFDSKNKQNAVDVYTLLEQRKQTGKKPAAGNTPPVRRPQQPMPRQEVPQPRQEVPQPQKKKGPGKGTKRFWIGCLIFVLVFYAATGAGLLALRGWLVNFEGAQPTVKCQEVFAELFEDPDWGKLYDLANMDDTGYSSKEDFVAYMTQLVGDQELTFMETSAGLSGDMAYVVRAGDTRIARFSLEDLNHVTTMTGVPDWQFKSVEFYLQWAEAFYIVAQEGATVLVNGTALDESAVVEILEPRANEYLPTFAQAPGQVTMKVTDLLTIPAVEVTDANGQTLEVSYDEATATFTALPDMPQITEDREKLALKAVETYALYMSGKANANNLAAYFDRNSQTFQDIVSSELYWVQKGSNYSFVDQVVTNYRVYSDDIFSVRVSMNLQITRTEDGSIRDNVIDRSLFFTKNSSGEWVCFEMTAVDVDAASRQVRLTFIGDDGEILQSGFVDAEGNSVACPVVTAPEGKTFSGWTVEQTDENGQTVRRLVFIPDETGTAQVTPGTALEPMVLSPLFE